MHTDSFLMENPGRNEYEIGPTDKQIFEKHRLAE